MSFAMSIRNFIRPMLLVTACACLTQVSVLAHEGHAVRTASPETYGEVRFLTSCGQEIQPRFERAVAMLHNFFYPETLNAFTAITRDAPDCAMGWWGVAISLRPNPLVAPFPPELLARGWQAIERARAAPQATERERDWIDALAIFFQDYDRLDQRSRTLAYEAAMERLAAKYPDDDEAQIFHALALNEAVDLADRTYARQLRAATILERIQDRLPNHPGVPHYVVHSYDYAPLAERGLAAARRYAALAPASPHALHMPSHIFSTLGLWQEAIAADRAGNARAAEYTARAVPALAGANRAANQFLYHGWDFLANAHLQLAQERPVAEIVADILTVRDPAPAIYARHAGFAAVPVRYAFERGAWAEAAALPVPRTPFAQVEAITWFGRALGAARGGDAAAAREAVQMLGRLRERLGEVGEAYWAEQVQVQETAARAWVAFADGQRDEAVRLMRAAADLEDRTEKHIAMENRLSPMRELLGELLLEAGQPAAALPEFEASLRIAPNRYRSFAGAAKAAEGVGDQEAARRWHGLLLELTREADTERPEIMAARRFVASR
jgi:tetratricopeptide (TPR) repeat protein